MPLHLLHTWVTSFWTGHLHFMDGCKIAQQGVRTILPHVPNATMTKKSRRPWDCVWSWTHDPHILLNSGWAGQSQLTETAQLGLRHKLGNLNSKDVSGSVPKTFTWSPGFGEIQIHSEGTKKLTRRLTSYTYPRDIKMSVSAFYIQRKKHRKDS